MFSLFKRCLNPATRNYVKRCKLALKRNELLPAPTTIDELKEALTRWPDESNWFRPSVATLQQMGLPAEWPQCGEATE